MSSSKDILLLLSGPIFDDTNIRDLSFGHIFYDFFKKHTNKTATVLIEIKDDVNQLEISVQDFFKFSINLAQNLRKTGIKRGDTIAIISKNHWKYLLIAIAAFYIGAKVFCLNPEYTPRELEHLLIKSPPKAIFCSKHALNGVLQLRNSNFINAEVYSFENSLNEAQNFDDLLSTDWQENSGDFAITSKPEDESFILTSSGTTGLPKAVALTHDSLKTALAYARDEQFLGLNENERTIIYLPLFHVFGLLISLFSILNKTRITLLENFKPDKFLSTIQEHKITKLFAVPPILMFLINSPIVSNYDLSSIKDILVGAASVSKNAEIKIIEKFGIKSTRQVYGMTEFSGGITVCPGDSNKSGSVGKPVHGITLKIRDIESGKTLKAHEVGEICVKGKSLMKEYCGNSEETRSVFDDEGFFRTGDIGYYDEEGFLYIVDRLKDIIKYKGFQVSPAELENFLCVYPGVKEVGVVGKPDERAGELPTAFIVKQPGKDLSEEEIVKYIEENFSAQKRLYGGVRFVQELPKNSTGKTLRRKLKEML